MLTVKATVKPSEIEGLGVFADEKIEKGATVWMFDPRFDLLFEPNAVEHFPDVQRELINRYAYLSTESGKYVYCTDDSRFINHSSVRNNLDVVPYPGEIETRGIANRDIEPGEEILINYRTFDIADAASTDPYLNS